jgi:predicted DsbA family dithiol-disulfide isomerase
LSSTADVSVSWKPFFLRPNIPKDGQAKDPNTPPERRASQRLKTAGAKVGIDFTGLTDRYPNSTTMHTLMAYALEHDGAEVQNALAEITFRHYFTDGRYPNEENLRAAAAEAGVKDLDAAMSYANNATNQAVVANEARFYSSQGVSGVPFFLLNGKPVASGAQPPSHFKNLLERALE